MIKIFLLTITVTLSLSGHCFNNDREKVINIFDKAFANINVKIKNLRSFTKDYEGSSIVTFDDGSKRGLVWFDKKCNVTALKISSGYGTVTMYYYKVLPNGKLSLTKTRKNKY